MSEENTIEAPENKDNEAEVKNVEDEKLKEGEVVKEEQAPIIRAADLDFVYNPGKTNEFHALKNISFEIYPEEFIMIFGPSGCGKSTLLNVIAGLETPDKGSIFVFDRDLTKMNSYDFAMYHRTEIGMIYQAYNLITSLTVLDNVVLPQMFVNVRRGRRQRWGRTLLDRFGILDHANKIPTELSGGQQQRIGIARAIVNNPSMVLADEPVGNLDSTSAKLVLEILEKLNTEEKKTIIMVTHNPEYLDYADRILYMKDGVITREVVNREKNHKKKKELKKPKTAHKEINELMRAYQGMSPEQINILIMPYKSKIFAHHFVAHCTMEELKIFEDAIQRKLLGTISQKDFFETLDKPSREGGVGFDSRTARKIVKRIDRIVRMAFFIYQKARQRKDENGKHPKISYEEKALKLKQYLYETCYKDYYEHLSEQQDNRIKKIIKDRIMSQVDKAYFFEFLDKSIKEGGVGLNRKTAKSMSEELELIIVLGYGVVGISRKKAKLSRQERISHREEEVNKMKQTITEDSRKMARPAAAPPGLPSSKFETVKEYKYEEKQTPSDPKDILDTMKEQLNQEVKTVEDSDSSEANSSEAEVTTAEEESNEDKINN